MRAGKNNLICEQNTLETSSRTNNLPAFEGSIMSDDISKKVLTTAVVFGSAFGVAAGDAAKDRILGAETFKQKLQAIREGVESGEIKPFTVKDGNWTYQEVRKVEVAQWQQTWEKVDWKKQS
jgi:hypothetical protein